MKLKVRHLIFLAILIMATVWIVSYRGTAQLRVSEGPIFGTMYHIKYESAEPLDKAIAEALKQVDASLSVFNSESTISKINSGASTDTDEMLREVVDKALKVSEATDGAFDITVMPLVNAWGFGFKNKSALTEARIDSLRALVGRNKFGISEETGKAVKADPRVMIDCGAIAKGYGVDVVARVLTKAGVRNFMVEIGGEVVVKGRNPETKRPWTVGISKPVDGLQHGDAELQTVLELTDCALATSGNYRNFYVENGIKYAHTIDPRTGKPVQHSLLSATVRAADCATADAYATAFMVMGLDAARRLLSERKDINAYLIYADDKGEMKVWQNIE